MGTVALEFTPPDIASGRERAQEIARLARDLLSSEGMLDRVNAFLFPGMIVEDDDRPVALGERIDVLEAYHAARSALPLEPIVTQVTAFSSVEDLDTRVEAIKSAGVDRVVFVGVPRTLSDGEGPGATPAAALERYSERLSGRGVVLIPTRDDEAARFEAKIAAGANLALCQMLFSDRIAQLLPRVRTDGPKPEILLSFGYTSKIEQTRGLIRWLIRDSTDAAQREMEIVYQISGMPFANKKAALVDIYRRVIDGVHESGFPMGIHFECPYEFNAYAFEVFHAMLDVWSPFEPAA